MSQDHEIAFHYENIDTCKGYPGKAFDDFCRNLVKFHNIIWFKTISMQGTPMSKYDNRDLWEPSTNQQRTKNKSTNFTLSVVEVQQRTKNKSTKNKEQRTNQQINKSTKNKPVWRPAGDRSTIIKTTLI